MRPDPSNVTNVTISIFGGEAPRGLPNLVVQPESAVGKLFINGGHCGVVKTSAGPAIAAAFLQTIPRPKQHSPATSLKKMRKT